MKHYLQKNRIEKQRREEMDAKYEQIEAARTKIYAEDCKQWSRHQTRASRRLPR